MASITPVRSGSTITATWTAEKKYDYIWASCASDDGSYARWVAVRSDRWEDPSLEWLDVPANVTITLETPKWQGGHNAWRTIATVRVP